MTQSPQILCSTPEPEQVFSSVPKDSLLNYTYGVWVQHSIVIKEHWRRKVQNYFLGQMSVNHEKYSAIDIKIITLVTCVPYLAVDSAAKFYPFPTAYLNSQYV